MKGRSPQTETRYTFGANSVKSRDLKTSTESHHNVEIPVEKLGKAEIARENLPYAR